MRMDSGECQTLGPGDKLLPPWLMALLDRPAGYQNSWGAAEEVVELIERKLNV